MSLQLFNMKFNTSYRIYMALMEKYNAGRKPLSLSEAIKESVYVFLQMGESIPKQVLDHLSAASDLRNVHKIGYGRKKRKDT